MFTGAGQAEGHNEAGEAAGAHLQPVVRRAALQPEAGDEGKLVLGEGEGGRAPRSRHPSGLG